MSSGTHHEIANQIDRLARLLRSRTQISGVNPAQWAALRYLAHANRFSRTPGAVTAWLGATKGTVSQTLIALERKGMITREKSTKDGRSVVLQVTEKGEALIRVDPLQDIEAAAAAFDDKEAEALKYLLNRLTANLSDLTEFATFGNCAHCRHFSSGHCAEFDVEVPIEEQGLICRRWESQATLS